MNDGLIPQKNRKFAIVDWIDDDVYSVDGLCAPALRGVPSSARTEIINCEIKEAGMKIRFSELFLNASLMFGLLAASSASVARAEESRTKVADPTRVVDKTLPTADEFIAVDSMPVALNMAQPQYPDSARQAGIEGSVWVKALVDKQGKVRDGMIVKNSGKNVGFEEAALAAAQQTTWKPASQKGKPVAVWVTYQVVFKLK